MVEISCYYVHYNREPINITFIRYKKFMKIILQNRKIIIAIENLKTNKLLFNLYILSLLCTEDTSKINLEFDFNGNDVYCVSTHKSWKYLYFVKIGYDLIELEKNSRKNPLLSQEPKRETSIKKINKLLNMLYNYFNTYHIENPLDTINKYLKHLIKDTQIQEIIKYEQMIYNLCCIKNFNNDIYASIMNYMR